MSTNPARIFRGLNSSHDWEGGQGSSSYATAQTAILLDVQTALMTFLGDAFWNATFGIDWFNLLGNKNTEDAIVAQCRSMIASRQGVTGINTVAAVLNRQTRRLFLEFNISTVYSANAVGSAQITV